MRALDPERLELRGTAVVEASAGTGKTYTITSLFLRLLLESELTVDQILVVTYTRAATAELRDRIRKRIALALAIAKGAGDDDELARRLCESASARTGSALLVERLERALSSVDEAPVLTIHAFCQRVLRDHAFESGSAFDTELTTHSAPLLDEIADDYFMRELYDTSAERAELLLDQPEALRTLSARVSGRKLRVLPEHVDELPCDGARFSQQLARARALWERERAAVVELVRGLRGVGQNAVNWANIVDQLLASGDASELLSKSSFVNFTKSGVRAKAKGSPPEHPFFDLAEELLHGARDHERARQSVELGFQRRFIDYLERELVRRTRETSVRTFDSLLTDLERALTGPGGASLTARLRTKYLAALVDEFQDTDPTQYQIFRRIFRTGSVDQGRPLLLIGDPKQAIYGFRGADVAAYLSARAEAASRVYTLEVNWRSDPQLIAALNALYEGVERPFLLPGIDYQRVRAPAGSVDRLVTSDRRAALDLALVSADDDGGDALRRSIAQHVASDIAALLASGAGRRSGLAVAQLTASDVAVLCRTNNEAALVQLALSECGVPSALSGDASVFDSEDVAQLERALTALTHPADARALRAFLSSIYGGFDAHAIVALEDDDRAWEQHRARFQRLHESWLSHGFMPALRGLVELYQVEQRLLTRSDGTRRITNLWHLAELLAEAALRERLGPHGLLRWLRLVQGDKARRAELTGDAHELRLESSDDAVTLTTIHKSKGLEYPVVYCPFLWDAAKLRDVEKKLVRFHDPAQAETLTLDLTAQAAHVEIAEEEAMAEALRLLYVALTRAKHRVSLVVPERADRFAQSALAYTLFGGGAQAGRERHKQQLGALIKSGTLEPALRARCEQLGSGLSVRKLVPATSARYASRSAASGALLVREPRRALDHSYRVASFSALIARERSAFGEAGIDRDQLASEPESDGRASAATSPLALAQFPRGTVAGQLVHEVLEHADFAGTEADLRSTAERFVRARGYPDELAASLTLGLGRALATPLDDAGLSLARISREQRRDELEFIFPVDTRLSPSSLARLFRAHKAPPALPSYAGELAELGFETLHGYLRGYIDLVFQHEGRFFVVDYKSNWLGARAEDYAPARLGRVMAEHHYFLQYHLYVLAVHRYLTLRVRDYDYDRHFGGVYYLFLRGMAPEHPAQTGVFFERPAQPLVQALDQALRLAPSEREVRP